MFDPGTPHAERIQVVQDVGLSRVNVRWAMRAWVALDISGAPGEPQSDVNITGLDVVSSVGRDLPGLHS